MKTALLTCTALLFVIAGFAGAQHGSAGMRHTDGQDAVRAAVLDYVEGIYEVRPERISRSVHPSLSKVGYWRGEKDAEYKEYSMTFDQLRKLAGDERNRSRYGKDSPKKIEIFEMLDKTASVKLSAQWGIDYLHLIKSGDGWMIRNVVWQSYPREDD